MIPAIGLLGPKTADFEQADRGGDLKFSSRRTPALSEVA